MGGVRIDAAVGQAFVQALRPAALEAALQAEQELDLEREATLRQWRLQAERAGYEAERAERRYRAVEPENRLVARTLEAEWERRLNECAEAEAELQRRQGYRPGRLSQEQREEIRALGCSREF